MARLAVVLFAVLAACRAAAGAADAAAVSARRTLDTSAPRGLRPGAPLKVGTFNVRYQHGDDGTPNAWEARKADLAELLRDLDLDVFGLQEVCPGQAAYLAAALPGYALAGDFRNADRASGEASPVLFRRRRFKELGRGTFWLSETPDVPGSVSWDSSLPRVCTWVRLAEAADGQEFVFANTHTDHKSRRACTEGIRLIVRRMERLADGAPIVFTGDHNSLETWAPAQVAAARLENAAYISETPPTGPWRTLNLWKWQEEETRFTDALALPVEARDRNLGFRIDYIYVTPGVRVLSYATRADPRPGVRLYPSDHFPVCATLVLP